MIHPGRIVGEGSHHLYDGLVRFHAGHGIMGAGRSLSITPVLLAKEGISLGSAFAVAVLRWWWLPSSNQLATRRPKLLQQSLGKQSIDRWKPPSFQAKHLNLYYGEKQALKDINIDIPHNEITALDRPLRAAANRHCAR